jgi:type I restriction enzyme S subunit
MNNYAESLFNSNNCDAKSIESICEVKGGIQKSSKRTPRANPRRYITVAHVQRNWIDISDPRYFEVSDEELEKLRLLSGDVLVIEGNGSADQIGRTALFNGEIEDCVHQNHVIRIRPNQRLILPDYLNGFLNSPPGQKQMRERSRTTSGLFNLSVGRIKSIDVPLPSLNDQQEIFKKLQAMQSKLDALKRHQAETSAELDALMPSVLDRAFRGEL